MPGFRKLENEPTVCKTIRDSYRDVLCQNKEVIRKILSLQPAIVMFERELFALKRKERAAGDLADAPTPTPDEIERNILPRDLGKLARFGVLRFARGTAPAFIFSNILAARAKAAQERERLRAQIESKARLIERRKADLKENLRLRRNNENNLDRLLQDFDTNKCDDRLSLHPGC